MQGADTIGVTTGTGKEIGARARIPGFVFPTRHQRHGTSSDQVESLDAPCAWLKLARIGVPVRLFPRFFGVKLFRGPFRSTFLGGGSLPISRDAVDQDDRQKCGPHCPHRNRNMRTGVDWKALSISCTRQQRCRSEKEGRKTAPIGGNSGYD